MCGSPMSPKVVDDPNDGELNFLTCPKKHTIPIKQSTFFDVSRFRARVSRLLEAEPT